MHLFTPVRVFRTSMSSLHEGSRVFPGQNFIAFLGTLQFVGMKYWDNDRSGMVYLLISIIIFQVQLYDEAIFSLPGNFN